MRQIFIVVAAILIFFGIQEAEAQVKPAQSQYLKEKGAFINPGFEQGKKGWTLTAGTFGFGSTALLNRNASITLTAQTLDFSQTVTTMVPFAGSQGLMSCRILANVSGFSIQTENNAILSSELDVISDGTWRKYEIPFVIDATSNGIRVVSDSAITDTIQIDDCYMGLAPDGYIQDVGQAHFVGSLVFPTQASCFWDNPSGSWANFPVDADCTTVNITGDLLQSSTATPSFDLPNARTDGYYRISANGVFYNSSGADASFRLSDGTTASGFSSSLSVTTSRQASNMAGQLRFNTAGTKTVHVQSRVTSGVARLNSSANDRLLQFDVYFFPDSNSTVVSQNTELTIDTTNWLSADIGGAGVVSNEDYDFINGNCTNAATSVCTFNTLFTEPPKCIIEAVRSDISCTPTVISTGSISLVCFNSAGTALTTTTNKQIFCRKKGVDLNKSSTIIGKFENINSSDLVVVKAEGNGANVLAIAANIVFTEVEDTYGAWSSDHTFTAPKSANYIFSGFVTSDVANAGSIYVQTPSSDNYASITSPTSTRYKPFYIETYLSEGEVANIRSSNAMTLTNTARVHHLTIQEVPDTESIVKNLLAESSQTKCQTRFVAANTSTIGVMSDLSFSNLVIGKRYSIKGHMDLTRSSTSSNNKNIQITIKNAGTTIQDSIHRDYAVTEYITTFAPLRNFTATGTTLTTEITATTNMLVVGNANRSYIELCQLPSTYVETTGF